MDVNIVVAGCALKFREACRSSVDFPFCSRDVQEWFFTEFRVWRDMRDPVFVFDLLSLVSTDMALLAAILRDYTLKFKIRVQRAFVDLREFLREAIRDRDCSREIADTFMEDIKEMSIV